MRPHRARDRQNHNRGGFALVLALSLMAFVVLLLLSITTLVQVEIRAADNSLKTLQARESARLALMLAIGELQKHAGPDQRVTARADILGDGNFAPEARFWTGVWDTTDPTAEPTWLVSGVNTDPNNLPVNTMQLVGEGSAGTDSTQYVYAPTLEVLNTSGAVSDQIAWWISDEGVKASVGKLPLNLRTNPSFVADASMPALSTMLSTSQGLEDLFTDYDRYTSSDAQNLERITSNEQLFGQNDFNDRSTWELSSENEFHAVTPFSLGVLASVLPNTNGGLMQDLSLFPKLIGTEFENIIERAAATADDNSTADTTVEALRQFVDLRGLDELGTLTDGDLASPVTPILSNILMAFTIRQRDQTDPRLYLRMVFFTELWNPYTSTMKTTFPNGELMEFQVEITGLPDVEVVKYTGTGDATVTAGSASVPMQDLLADPTNPDDALVIRLIHDHTEPWLPGRTKIWTGISNADETAGSSPYESTMTDLKLWNYTPQKLGGHRGIDALVDLENGSGFIRHFSSGSTNLRIKLYAFNPDTEVKSLLTDYGDIRYEPISTLNPETKTGYSSVHTGMTFGYHIQLREPHHSDDDPEYYRGLWLYDNDPRNPSSTFTTDWHLPRDDTVPEGSPYTPVINGFSPLASPTPEVINQSQSSIDFRGYRRLIDRSSPHFDKLWQDAPLFEIPRERPLSLASLQHLYFHNERPFKVGNSWGDTGVINTLKWFDRYYFSGLSRIDTADDYDSEAGLPNPTLLAYQFEDPAAAITRWQTAASDHADQSLELAQSALVMNRFNLNSTSVAAWKAVLGGLRINEWEYLNYPANTSNLSTLAISQDTRRRLFPRFSQSLSETYEAPQTPAWINSVTPPQPIAPSAFYRRGARHFDADEIESLSQEIVRLIKVKAMPYLSMEEFLSEQSAGNGSLLEQAIATVFAPNGRQQWDHQWETKGIRGQESEIIEIDHFSPGFLTQADVMTAIGPMLSPRSDTFKIRARSQSFSQLGIETGSATIEATLQRTPEPVDPTASINQPNKRRLKLISMRWLSNDEI